MNSTSAVRDQPAAAGSSSIAQGSFRPSMDLPSRRSNYPPDAKHSERANELPRGLDDVSFSDRDIGLSSPATQTRSMPAGMDTHDAPRDPHGQNERTSSFMTWRGLFGASLMSYLAPFLSGTTLESNPSTLPGTLVKIEEIGRGGYSCVWRGVWTKPGGEQAAVAIKIVTAGDERMEQKVSACWQLLHLFRT